MALLSLNRLDLAIDTLDREYKNTLPEVQSYLAGALVSLIYSEYELFIKSETRQYFQHIGGAQACSLYDAIERSILESPKASNLTGILRSLDPQKSEHFKSLREDNEPYSRAYDSLMAARTEWAHYSRITYTVGDVIRLEMEARNILNYFEQSIIYENPLRTQ